MYKAEYLRRPTSTDIQKLYEAHEARHGFPGMLGSIDCIHWNWRNYPTELRGQYMRGDHQYPTMILEAVTSQDLWFWHVFYGVAGSNNDLNILYQSPLFDEKYHGTGPDCSFDLNVEHYKHGYYLADGIYPTWAVFVKAYPYPITDKMKRFKVAQESARKDVERAFGVLKGRWAILKMSAQTLTVKKTKNIMYACIILHNMILKDEGAAISPMHQPDSPMTKSKTQKSYMNYAMMKLTTSFDLILLITLNIVLNDVESGLSGLGKKGFPYVVGWEKLK
ncbi:protein ANTAGONIST OF LIKE HETEROCHROMATIN PROTEIN 1-like [Lactuca sativa]|uniref:protein ANTAGONIST OF LIKE HETEROCHROMATIN PROTEIN 1-like n=1 Tax=Lactuca sativa TaxID=4236 RepID=UPI000CD96875|nr:protein ANTAGONIST OF LIKE HETEROCHROMATIN PROTEIN 1-like [Lactuca sativa]